MSMDVFLKLKTKLQFVCYLQSWVLSHSSVILRILSLHFGEVDDEHVESHNLKKNLQKFSDHPKLKYLWNIYSDDPITRLLWYSGHGHVSDSQKVRFGPTNQTKPLNAERKLM